MRTSIIVIDDFYCNPDEVRAGVLKADFPVTGNYPGKRTKPWLNDGLRQVIQDAVKVPITYWPTGEHEYNGSFQIATGKDQQTWLHIDPTNWAGVLYMTPDAPPSAGTAVYRHIETGLEKLPTEEDAKRLGYDSRDELEEKLHSECRMMEKWEETDRIANKYNRLILFRGERWHRSVGEYFGDSLETGRLFQLFFFNTEY